MKVSKIDICRGEMEFKSGCDINQNSLNEYYRLMYPDRAAFMESSWVWLYRGYFMNSKLPIVLVLKNKKNKVIAHGGMIPVNLLIDNLKIKAGWFIDLSVLPEYQRCGMGAVLVNRRMELTDIQMTFPNDKSYSVFKKKGWNESIDTYLHYVFIYPFNHPWFTRRLPRLFRSLLNYFSHPLIAFFNKKYAYPDPENYLHLINEDLLISFYDQYSYSKTNSQDIITPVRDTDFIRWRILNSPNRDKYMIYRKNGFSGLVFLKRNLRIDILWVTDLNNMEEIRNMVSTLAVYGRKHRFIYIRFYTTNRKLSKYLKIFGISIVTHPRFLFHANNSELAMKLQGSPWGIELVDSDFEFHG